MARNLSVSPAHSHVYLQTKWIIPAFAFPTVAGPHLSTRRNERLSWPIMHLRKARHNYITVHSTGKKSPVLTRYWFVTPGWSTSWIAEANSVASTSSSENVFYKLQRLYSYICTVRLLHDKSLNKRQMRQVFKLYAWESSKMLREN